MPKPSPALTEEAIRDFVVAFLRRRMRALQITDMEVSDNLNMIDSGLLDSIMFIEMLAQVEDRFAVQVPLDRYDPAEFVTVDGFVRCVLDGRREPLA